MALKSEVVLKPRTHPPTLRDFLEQSASQNPKGPAISDVPRPADHLAHFVKGIESTSSNAFLTWNYAQLQTAALRTAIGLLDKGIQRGSRIALFMPNGIEYPLMFWVAAILQLTIVPLDTGLLDPGRELMLHYYLTTLEADNYVVNDSTAAERLDEALRQKGLKSRLRLMLEQTSRSGWLNFSDLVGETPSTSFEDDTRLSPDAKIEADGRRVVIIYFTSGTSTGNPKGVPIRVKNLLNTMANRSAIPVEGDAGICSTVYSRAASWGLTNTMLAGGHHTIIMRMPFSPANFAEAIEAGGHFTFTMPAFVHILAEDKMIQSRDLSSFRQLVVGGDVMTEAIYHKAQKLFSGINVVTGFGMTEGSGSFGWGEDHVSMQDLPTYHGVMVNGSVMPGSGARICDVDGNVLPRGEPGHLHLGGLSMIDEYLGNVHPETFYHDDLGNWLLTGDRAVMLENGTIAVLGRSKDVVKRAGVPLSPAVIETVLSSQMGKEATVLAVPHDTLGEVPLCIVKAEPGQTLDVEAIKETVVKNLGPEYELKDVVPLSSLGFKTWPLNTSGKIEKLKLKEAVVQK